MRILAVGDVVGVGGTEYIRRHLWQIRKENHIDLVVLNGENAAKGNGLDKDTADALIASGADVITSGNHIWKKFETRHFIEDYDTILRPANYPDGTPGQGWCIADGAGYRVLVISLLGNTFMEALESPFTKAEWLLDRYEGEYDFAVIDFHAEATSEKAALARFLDGRVSAVFGTHTHVQTNDARVLPRGTGFVTDIGMVGADESILGVKPSCVLEKFLTKMPVRFEEAEGEIRFCGAIFDIDTDSGKTTSVELVNLK